MAIHVAWCVVILMVIITSSSQRQLHFAAIVPANNKYSFSIQKLQLVVQAATEVIQQQHQLSNYTIHVTYGDSGLDIARAPDSAFRILCEARHLNQTVDAFLGPMVDQALEHVARQASLWRIPLLTGGGVSYIFDNRTQFSTLIRLGYLNMKDAVYLLHDIMSRYSWMHAKLLYVDKVPMSVGMGSVCHDVHHTIREVHRQKPGKSDLQDIEEAVIWENYEEMLVREVGRRYAIVVLCAPPDVVRSILIKAHSLNFTNGHYVFIVLNLYRTAEETQRPWYRDYDSHEVNEAAKYSFRFVINIAIRKPMNSEYSRISSRIKDRTPNIMSTLEGDNLHDYLAIAFDAIHVFVQAKMKYDINMLNNRSTDTFVQHLLNESYSGVTGNISFDENGGRFTEYSVLQMDVDANESSGHFHVIANYMSNTRTYDVVWDINWGYFHDSPPMDIPISPYSPLRDKEETHTDVDLIHIPIIVVAVAVISTFSYTLRRGYRRSIAFEISSASWRIKWRDVTIDATTITVASSPRVSIQTSFGDDVITSQKVDVESPKILSCIAFVRGEKVHVKYIKANRFTGNTSALSELNILFHCNHNHLCRFVGVCLDEPHQSIISAYCDKGSLKDVLENEDISLNWTFRFSLLQDIGKGMSYLHDSYFRRHGNLSSRNCLVDSRFSLKITDFGLHFLRDKDSHVDDSYYVQYERKLWTAPELLRQNIAPEGGTAKGDVYSFGIISQEIVYRSGVFFTESSTYLSTHDKYERVKEGVEPYLRPTLHSDDCLHDNFYTLITQCWAEDADERPSFRKILLILKLNSNAVYRSLPDSLLQRLESYATEMETLIDERTIALKEEKETADAILHQMLPRSVAKQLIIGEVVSTVSYDSVTIFFSDIVGFTSLAATCTPMEICALLNDLYTVFDSITNNYEVYKVETIGDAYMVVSGLPVPNGIQHAAEIGCMALNILSSVKSFRINFRPDTEIQLRIGIHTGPVCTGVVGNKMPRYCLFGNTVTTAARYESSGLPHMIHISAETKTVLDEIGGFKISTRGEIAMKGLGRLATFWLLGSTTTLKVSKTSIRNVENVSFPDMQDASRLGSPAYSKRGSILSLISTRSMIGSATRETIPVHDIRGPHELFVDDKSHQRRIRSPSLIFDKSVAWAIRKWRSIARDTHQSAEHVTWQGNAECDVTTNTRENEGVRVNLAADYHRWGRTGKKRATPERRNTRHNVSIYVGNEGKIRRTSNEKQRFRPELRYTRNMSVTMVPEGQRTRRVSVPHPRIRQLSYYKYGKRHALPEIHVKDERNTSITRDRLKGFSILRHKTQLSSKKVAIKKSKVSPQKQDFQFQSSPR